MARYRNASPQLQGDLYLSDGGIETTLIFHEGLHLPHFATFDLLTTPARSKEGELQ
jgi:homocysteine S-methyltransferase